MFETHRVTRSVGKSRWSFNRRSVIKTPRARDRSMAGGRDNTVRRTVTAGQRALGVHRVPWYIPGARRLHHLIPLPVWCRIPERCALNWRSIVFRSVVHNDAYQQGKAGDVTTYLFIIIIILPGSEPQEKSSAFKFPVAINTVDPGSK